MAFLALGLTLPVLLLQDSWRFAFFAHGRGALALVNDTVWAIALVAGLAILRGNGPRDGVLARLRLGCLGRLRRGARSVPGGSRSQGCRDSPVAGDALGPRASVPGRGHHQQRRDRSWSPTGSALLLGLAAVGAVQAASLLMGPYMVVIWGMGLVMLPEGVRILRVSPRRLPHLCVLTSITFSALAAAWGIALLIVLPMGFGQALLGALWRPTYPLVLPQTLYVMAFAVTCGAGLGLHALGAARRSLRASIITSATLVVFSVVGAAVAGAVGAVSGGAAAMWVGALVFWWELRPAMRTSPLVPSRSRSDAANPAEQELAELRRLVNEADRRSRRRPAAEMQPLCIG